jgi:hypothetical protein
MGNLRNDIKHSFQIVLEKIRVHGRCLRSRFNITGDRPDQFRGIYVTESYFRLFGPPLIPGPTFTPQEDSPNGGRFVVLSYGFW